MKPAALTPSNESAPPQYVTDLNDHDVIMGRGQPILNYPGNLIFRQLIAANKKAYTATGQHAIKDEVARSVLQQIAAAKGRFLRKIEDEAEKDQLGIPDSVQHAWVIVDEATRLQKVKQALREQLNSKPDATLSTSKGPSQNSASGGESKSSRKRKSTNPRDEGEGKQAHFRGAEWGPIERNLHPSQRKPPGGDTLPLGIKPYAPTHLTRAASAPPCRDRSHPNRNQESASDQPLFGVNMPPSLSLQRSLSVPFSQQDQVWNPFTGSYSIDWALQQQEINAARPTSLASSGYFNNLDSLVRMKNSSVPQLDMRCSHREQALAMLQQARSSALGGSSLFPNPQPPLLSDHNITMRDLLSMRAGTLSDYMLQCQQHRHQPAAPPSLFASTAAGSGSSYFSHSIFGHDTNASLLASHNMPPAHAAGGFNEALWMQQYLLVQQEARFDLLTSRHVAASHSTTTMDTKQPSSSAVEREKCPPSLEDSKPKATKKKRNDPSEL